MHPIFDPRLSLDGILGVFSSVFAALFATLASVLVILLVAVADRLHKTATITGLILRRAQFVVTLLRGMHSALSHQPSDEVLDTSKISSVPLELQPDTEDHIFAASYPPSVSEIFAIAAFHMHILRDRVSKSPRITVGDFRKLLVDAAWWFTVGKSRLKWRAWMMTSRSYVAMAGAMLTGAMGIIGLISLVFTLQTMVSVFSKASAPPVRARAHIIGPALPSAKASPRALTTPPNPVR
jgi:hypothetical protein